MDRQTNWQADRSTDKQTERKRDRQTDRQDIQANVAFTFYINICFHFFSPSIDPRHFPNEHWNPAKHTVPLPTDAYGCIDFRGTHTNKAQYIRYPRT